ncbi:histone deacetylase 8-like [Liolophura sinensis]|uniref:histone deacetylase 8-like n=1 Tax=Liolophura sinensis TaxID=3198878 RepID=UPI003158BF7E
MQNDLLHQANGESDIFGSHSCCTNERGDVCDTISPMSNIVFDENTVKVCQEATVLTHCVENVLSSVNKALTNDREECKLDKDDHISEYVACESIKMLETDKQTSLTCVKSCMPVCSSEGKPEQAPCGVNGCNIVTYQEKQSIPEVNQTGTTKKYGPVRGGRTVVYVHSDEYMQLCDAMIRVPGRACMVHRLIEAYGLLKYLCIVPPSKLTREEILKFHSEEYVDVLERLDRDGEEGYDEQAQRCGLGYDCPAEPGVYEYATSVAGATVTAAQCLMEGKCTVAINWFGGWHHAKKDQASGFCYVNDIVLGILKLREKYQRVLYIDLDLHHGDGVEDAFSATSKVFTLSFHKYSAGFFPGTGSVKDVGFGKGRFFSLNIPLLDGIQDQQFFSLFLRVVEKVREVFSPEAVVCQCGADGLAGDPMNSFNLTHLSLGRCVYSLLKWNVPLLLLGGGGYEHANTARCWTFITSIAAFKKLPEDIPDHQYFTEYGPSYELAVTAGYRKNLNTPEYLKDVCRKALGILQKTSKILAYNEVV